MAVEMQQVHVHHSSMHHAEAAAVLVLVNVAWSSESTTTHLFGDDTRPVVILNRPIILQRYRSYVKYIPLVGRRRRRRRLHLLAFPSDRVGGGP